MLKESSDDYSTTYIHGLNDYPLIEKNIDGANESSVLYVYGPTGLVAFNYAGNWNYILKDHLGSTRVVVTDSNSVSSYYDYMPFGDVLASSVQTGTPYQFTGQELDTDTDLHNFRARLYDSDAAIFYGADPAGQGYSSFAYAGNNPVIRIDKDGRFWHIVIGAVVGGIINTIAHADECNSFWDYAAAFGVGAGAGALGAATGGAVFAAAGGTASVVGSGGAIAGFASGALGTGVQMITQSFGNAAFFNDPFLTPDQLLTGMALSGGFSGLLNGTLASVNGKNFWNGTQFPSSVQATPLSTGINAPKLDIKANELPKAKLPNLTNDVPSQKSLIVKGLTETKLNIGNHAELRMAQRGITTNMIEKALLKGQQFWDPQNKVMTYVLKNGFASGKDLLVSQNPLTLKITTVIRGEGLITNRLIPLK